MKIKYAKENLKKILKQNHMPVLLWGQPGIGKSDICKQIADENKWEFIDIRLPLLMPSDLMGLPYPDKEYKKANWLYPSFFPEPDSKKDILILFDEIGNASMAVQNCCYRIILDRAVGEHYKFPEGVRMVAASNREIDKSGVGKFSKALANRFIHFEVDSDLDSWKEWAWKNGISDKIIAFLKFKQNMLCVEPNIEDKAYPTPRSWTKVSHLMDHGIMNDEVIAGTVGKGAAAEFFSYLSVYSKLPNIDKILKGEKIGIPKTPDVTYAVSSSLVMRANKDNITNIFKYTERMSLEFHILTIRDIARRDETILNHYPDFKKWMNRYIKYFNEDEESKK